MSKKLLSLVFVLALAGMASAAAQWIGPGFTAAAGAWETTSNWDVARLPALTDTSVRWDCSNASNGSNITVSTAVTMGQKGQSKNGSTRLEILNGGSIACEGSVEMSSTLTAGYVTIDAGGVWNAAQKLTQTNGTFKLGSVVTGVASVDVYGTLNVKGSLATSDLAVAQGTSVGIGRLMIRNGGLANVDAYSINSAVVASGTYAGEKRGKITIEDGGLMKILGNKVAQVNADITAGTIVAAAGGHLGVWQSNGYTYVPEPATIALLGLGSLMLMRRKR